MTGEYKSLTRRAILGTTAAIALAGCSNSGSDATDTSNGDAAGTDSNDSSPDSDTTDDGTEDNSLPAGFESLWELEVGIEEMTREYRTAQNGDFLAIGLETELYAVDTAEQEVIWTYDEPGTITGLIANDTHVFAHYTPASGTGDNYGFRQSDGEVVQQRSGNSWGTERFRRGESIPMVVLSDHVVVPYENQDFEDTFYVMEADAGLVGSLTEQPGTIWVDGEGRNVVHGRNIGDDVEVVGKKISDESNIERIWEIPDLLFDGTIVVDGTLIGVNDEEVLSLIDIESGEKREMSIDGEDFGGAPEFASRDGTLFYTHSLSETLYAIDPAAEEVLWRTEDELSRGRLLIVDGAVVLERDGDMRALGIESGEGLAAGKNPQLGSMLEADGDVVYSCEKMVQALDADF